MNLAYTRERGMWACRDDSGLCGYGQTRATAYQMFLWEERQARWGR